MNYGIISDLHLDFREGSEIEILMNKINNAKCDKLIIVGDIHENPKAREYFFSLLNKPYFSVDGNHDYYGREISDDFSVDGDIAGGTLWTNFNNDPVLEQHSVRALRDFIRVHSVELPGEYVLPREMRSIFESQAYRIFAKEPKIAVTHFAPCHLSTHPRFKHDPYNPYFVNNLYEKMMNSGIRLWVHGHVHDSFDYQLENGMRVVCNPLGYPHERNSVEDYEVMIVNPDDHMMHSARGYNVEVEVRKVFDENPDKVIQAREKPSLQGWFVGQVMKATHGTVNPTIVERYVNEFFESVST